MHIYGIYKNGTSEPSRELGDTVGNGEGGKNWESCIDRYARSCVDFPGGVVVKKPPANAKDVRNAGSIPEWGRSPGGGHGNPLQYSCLENPMNRGAWQTMVHRVAQSWTQLKWPSTQACVKSWEAAIKHREPSLVLCDDADKWDWRKDFHSGAKGNQHKIVKQFFAN